MTGRVFVWEATAARVVMAPGAVGRVGDEVSRLGGERVLLLSGGASARDSAARLATELGPRLAEHRPGAVAHVPEWLADATVESAARVRADLVLTIGGGSVTGLGKAVAVRSALPLVAVPTTYSGSEMTPIWALTTGGRKRTAIDAAAVPRAVVYDPELCAGMPPRLAAASGMNALAHCVEGLWAPRSNPITDALAEEAMRRLLESLPRVVDDPSDVEAHADNLIGACLAGAVTAQAGTGLHHRTCHVLGGGWDLPHAETHAVVLPHSTAAMLPRLPEVEARLRVVLHAEHPAVALHELLGRLGLPSSLAALGMPATGLADAAAQVAAAGAGDPLAPDEPGLRRMLDAAFAGLAPPTR